MRHTFSLLLLFLVTINVANSQVRKTYKVMPGEKILEALPDTVLYLYREFKNGTVNFKNNNVGANRLNYNQLLDEIQFIDSKGDTLSLSEENTVASIYIEKDTFYFYQGYVKKMLRIKDVVFAGKKFLALSNKQHIGAMGELSSASIDTHSRMSTSQGIKDLVQKELLTFAEYNNYFIGDAYYHFKPLNKKNTLNMYAKQQAAVEGYLSQNTINYFKEEDVRKLITFLETL